MNIYNAIMRAADHIERNQNCYRFELGARPSGDDGQGCALAWIGYFLGVPAVLIGHKDLYALDVSTVLGHGRYVDKFFTACRPGGSVAYRRSVVSSLRAYAAKHHAPAKPTQTFASFMDGVMERVNGERIPEDA